MAKNEDNRRTIISRANRMLRQSQTLRKLSDELLKESKDLPIHMVRSRGASYHFPLPRELFLA
jgi:hypothetical protein